MSPQPLPMRSGTHSCIRERINPQERLDVLVVRVRRVRAARAGRGAGAATRYRGCGPAAAVCVLSVDAGVGRVGGAVGLRDVDVLLIAHTHFSEPIDELGTSAGLTLNALRAAMNFCSWDIQHAVLQLSPIKFKATQLSNSYIATRQLHNVLYYNKACADRQDFDKSNFLVGQGLPVVLNTSQ